MSDRKRMRSGGFEDNEKSVDWMKEYFKKDEELRRTREELQVARERLHTANEKLHAANERLHAAHEKLQEPNKELQVATERLHAANERLQVGHQRLQAKNEELQVAHERLHEANERLHAQNEELKQIMRLNAELMVTNKEFEKDLTLSNTKLLQEKKSLSATGAIELLEWQKFSSAPSYCTSRQGKYEWLYKSSKTFKSNVQKYVGSNISDRDVGILGKDLYASASHDIHTSFTYGSEVIIRRSNYQKDQLRLLEAICQTLNVRFKTI